MNMSAIIFRNISKKKLRTILTIIIVVLGTRLMFSLLTITVSDTQRSLEIIRRISVTDTIVYNGSRGLQNLWSSIV